MEASLSVQNGQCQILIALYVEGGSPANLVCCFLRRNIAWACWSLWTWSQTLLRLTELAPTIIRPPAADVLATTNSLHKLATRFTFQLAFHPRILTEAVQPRHRLVITIELTSSLLECSVNSLAASWRRPLPPVRHCLSSRFANDLRTIFNSGNPLSCHAIRETYKTTELSNKEHWKKPFI